MLKVSGVVDADAHIDETDATWEYMTEEDARYFKPISVDPERPIELWPRQLAREPHVIAAQNFCHDHDAQYHRTSNNARKLLDGDRSS